MEEANGWKNKLLNRLVDRGLPELTIVLLFVVIITGVLLVFINYINMEKLGGVASYLAGSGLPVGYAKYFLIGSIGAFASWWVLYRLSGIKWDLGIFDILFYIVIGGLLGMILGNEDVSNTLTIGITWASFTKGALGNVEALKESDKSTKLLDDYIKGRDQIKDRLDRILGSLDEDTIERLYEEGIIK